MHSSHPLQRFSTAVAAALLTATFLAACALTPPAPAPDARQRFAPFHGERFGGGERGHENGAERERERVMPKLLANAPAELPVSDALGDWMQVGPLNVTNKVYSLSLSRQDVDVLYVAYGVGGVWKTSDGGAHWLQITNRFTRNNWVLVEAHPLDDDIVLIAGGFGVNPNHPEQAGVHLSLDGGGTFRDITPGQIDPLEHFLDRAEFDPEAPGTIFLPTGNGLYKTSDWGTTWRNVLPVPPAAAADDLPHLMEVALKPGDSRIVLAERLGLGMMRSTDRGETWTRVGSESFVAKLGNSRIAFSDADPNRVYVLTYPGDFSNSSLTYAYRSADGGLSWNENARTIVESDGFWTPGAPTAYGSGTRAIQMAIDVDPRDKNHVIAATASYFDSYDGLASRNFDAVYRPPLDILAVEFSRVDPDRVFVGSDQGLFRIDARGRRPPDDSTVHRIDLGVYAPHAFDFEVSDDGATRLMYLSLGHYGAPVSGKLDAPADRYTWRSANALPEYAALSVSPLDARLVFAGGFTVALARATNRGRDYEDFEFVDPLYHGEADPAVRIGIPSPHVAFHPTDARRVIVNARESMYRSPNAGALGSWTPFGPPASLGGGLLGRSAYSPANPDVIYVADQYGRLLVHRVAAGTWESIEPRLNDNPVVVYWFTPSPVAQDTVYFGTTDVLECRDYGRTCRSLEIPTSLDGQPVPPTIAFDDTNPDRLFVTTATGIATRLLSQPGWVQVGSHWPRVSPTDLVVRRGRVYASSLRGVYELVPDFATRFPAPKNFVARLGTGGTVELTWDAPTDARGHQVFLGTTLVSTVFGNPPRATMAMPRDGERCWRVASFDADNDMSAFSEPLCIDGEIVPCFAPPPPTEGTPRGKAWTKPGACLRVK